MVECWQVYPLLLLYHSSYHRVNYVVLFQMQALFTCCVLMVLLTAAAAGESQVDCEATCWDIRVACMDAIDPSSSSADTLKYEMECKDSHSICKAECVLLVW